MNARLVGMAGVLGGMLLVLGGCTGILGLGGSAPVNFYVLSPVPESATARPATPPTGQIGVGVAPVVVPEYMEGRMIVTRTSPYTVNLAELQSWAAPLSEHATAVLIDNLSTLIPSERVLRMPLPRPIAIDFEARVRLETFERTEDGSVQLVARWLLFDERTGEASQVKTSRYQSPVLLASGAPAPMLITAAEDIEVYEAIVAAMSRVLGDLSREIAAAIRAAAMTTPSG
ncbi:MAG: membrane integrity-associated transporter subunit PqiC [Rhodospirillales bacterium]